MASNESDSGFVPLLEVIRRDSEERDLQEAEDSKSTTRGPEIGSTGLEVFSGFITGDIDPYGRVFPMPALIK